MQFLDLFVILVKINNRHAIRDSTLRQTYAVIHVSESIVPCLGIMPRTAISNSSSRHGFLF